MKKIVHYAASCFIIVLLVGILSVKAFASGSDTLTYKITGNKCTVVSCKTDADNEIIIPDTYNGAVVTAVADNAFRDCLGISSVILPETLESIGDCAFWGCSNLTSVNIPDSVVALGSSVFYKCSNLVEIELSDNIIEIPEKTFYFCAKLQNIKLPSSLNRIGADAFYGCGLIKNVVLPENTVSILNSSFKNCISLESIYIPSGLVSIGNDAFSKCESLKTVYYSGESSLSENFSIAPGNEILTNASWVFNHSHFVNSKSNAIEATCTTDGYTEFICECSFYGKNNFIPSVGHKLTVFTVLKQPDCKTEGTVLVSCEKCNYSETMTTPSNSHKIVIDEKIDATCFQDGKTKGSHCFVCGEVIEKQKIIPALGHDYSETIYDSGHLVSAATYTKEAVYRYSCVRCSAVGNKTHLGAKLILAKPAQTASSSTSDSITLLWSKVKDASGYGIYYKNSAKKWVLYKKTANSYIKFPSLPSGKIYEFAIKAFVIENGKIIPSPYHQFITEATKPAKPSKIISAQNETAVKISWSAVKGATGYRVYGYNAKINKWVVLKSSTKLCTHITENLKSGSYYKFAVMPYIDIGSKVVWSDEYAEIITATKPLAPTIKSTALAGAVNLQWSKVNGADGYVVYGSTRPDMGYVRLKVTAANEYKISGLARNQTFYFRVYSVKKSPGGYIFSYSSDIKAAKTR